MADLILSPGEARVLAALVEKAATTPQYYPMTVNALMLAANQKNARHPVMALSEGDTGAALNALEQRGLVRRDDHAGRVPKWRQQFATQLLLKPPVAAVLATLMLRGPQTAAELRTHAAALGGPAEAEGIAAALADLSDRAAPMVTSLPRAAGQAATRYAHTLCGDVVVEAFVPPGPASLPSADRIAELEARIDGLEARLAALEHALS